MALRANYQGIKKVRVPLSLTTEGTLTADVSVIAPTEPGAKSEHAYSVGDELYLSDGILYVVTSPIAIDDTFIIKPDENYNLEPAGSITEQIKELEGEIDDLEDMKADISSIGTDEAGATASQAYAVGDHFYKDGKFCTVISSIAEGATLTKNTNYVEGTIADYLRLDTKTVTTSNTKVTITQQFARKYGQIKYVYMTFTLGEATTASTAETLATVPADLKPLSNNPTGLLYATVEPYAPLAMQAWIQSTTGNIRLKADLPAGDYNFTLMYI